LKDGAKVVVFDGMDNPQLRVENQPQLRTFIAEILFFVKK